MLRLALLGSPEISLQGNSLTDQITGRGFALLVYLIVTGQQYTRNRLADLLWDDLSNYNALKKVRNILPGLRALLETHLQISRETAAFNKNSSYWLDVEEFRSYLTSSQAQTNPQLLEKVLALYRDDFLGNFYVRNAPAFEEWVTQQREELHQLAVEGFQRLISYYLQQNNLAGGLAASKRLLAIEPWHEEAHRCQMLFLARSGKREAALAQYATCQRILAAEFNSEPTTETVALYEQIRTGALDKVIETGAAALNTHQPIQGGQSLYPGRSVSAHSLISPQINWHEIPYSPKFYGRQSELSQVNHWLSAGCRLIGIFGLGGQGKTALAAQLIRTLAASALPPSLVDATPQISKATLAGFQQILWYSVGTEPPQQMVRSWLQTLSEQPLATLPEHWEQLLSLLMEQLRRRRCLLIIDQMESTSQYTDATNAHLADSKMYNALLQRIGTSDHQSCLLLLSRESPLEFTRWEEQTSTIRFLHLTGLTVDMSRQLLQGYGIAAPDAVLATLRECYSGNPLALIIVAETIQQLFAGNVERFLAAGIFVFDDLRTMLDQQFARFGVIEREILFRLAIEAMPLSTEALWATAISPPARRAYLEAHRSLLRCLWIEPHADTFGLPLVLQHYIIDYLTEQIGKELVSTQNVGLMPHSLLNGYLLRQSATQAPDRANQPVQLLAVITKQLIAQLGQAGARLHVQSQVAMLEAQPQVDFKYALLNLQYLLLQLDAERLETAFNKRSIQMQGLTSAPFAAPDAPAQGIVELSTTHLRM